MINAVYACFPVLLMCLACVALCAATNHRDATPLCTPRFRPLYYTSYRYATNANMINEVWKDGVNWTSLGQP